MGPDEVASVAEDRFGLSAASVEPLVGGCLNEVWKLDAPAGRFVLRRTRQGVPLARVRFEHRVLGRLAGRFAWVVPPLAGVDGATVQVVDGRAVTLFPFVSGMAADLSRPSHRLELARAAGALHAATAGDGSPLRGGPVGWHGADPDWAWPRVRRAVAAHGAAAFGLGGREAEELVAFFDAEQADIVAGLDRLRTRRPSLPVGLIHGDLNPRNVLMEGDELAGIVDWESCKGDWCAVEAAELAGWAAAAGCGPPVLVDLLAAYRRAGGPLGDPTSPLVQETLDRLYRAAVIGEVVWSIDTGVTEKSGAVLRDVAHALHHPPFSSSPEG